MEKECIGPFLQKPECLLAFTGFRGTVELTEAREQEGQGVDERLSPQKSAASCTNNLHNVDTELLSF
jgi:hypothetical protein